MTRVLRYPRLCVAACLGTVTCAFLRDYCVDRGMTGWSRVLLCATLMLLGLCFVLISCRFFVDEIGVGVGFLLRVRRTEWENLAAVGLMCCNSRRKYLYGLYRGSADFLHMLHRAPRCGPWGFVVPSGKKLTNALNTLCPYEIDFSPVPVPRRGGRMRMLWHQAALYALMLIPASAVAFLTGTLMLIRASGENGWLSVIGLTCAALCLFSAGLFLLYRALLTVFTCPGINETGVRAGYGLYLPWEDVRFGYVHRVGQVSGMFLLSEPLEAVTKRGSPPIRCLSMPDTSTLLLAYLTYCPHAPKGMDG